MQETTPREMKPPQAKVYSFEELLAQDGYLIYTNVGISMLPLLRQRRDVIEIRAKGPGRCGKYDIVLYRRGNKYILHRILKVLPQGYVIAGDHNTFREYDVTDGMILGTVHRIIRNGREITMDNRLYRLYVHLWCDFYPVRAGILSGKVRLWRLLSRIKRAVLKRGKEQAKNRSDKERDGHSA